MIAPVRALMATVIVSTLWVVSAYAQMDESRPMPEPGENRAIRSQEEIVSFEPFYRSIRGDSADVDLLFRIRRDFLVFARSPQHQTFSAEAEITIEILDSTQNSIARHIRTLSLTSPDNSQSFLRRTDDQGQISFRLKQGRYSALCIVTDKEADHKQFMRRIPLFMPRPHVIASSLLLAQAVDSIAGIIPCNLGGNAFFSRPLFAVASVSAHRSVTHAVYSIDALRFEGDEKKTIQRDTTVVPTVIPHMALVPFTDSVHSVMYRFTPDTSRNILILSLNGERLAQERYMVKIKFDAGDTATVRSNFAMRWIDMPQSLRDLDFATQAMKYITTEEEFDNLTGGRRSKRIEAFDAFWKKRDPTPETAYNEQLAEYFRRVDHAFTAFRTLKEGNGAMTDRGRIYILYGSPAATERQLSPSNAPREIWRYPALKKLFTFEDPSRQGNYKLILSDTQ